MDFLDELRAALYAPQSSLIEFYADYRNDASSVHAFFEGDADPSVYVNVLNSQLPAGYAIYTYRCGNKSTVYYIYSRLDWTVYHKPRALFFVDKDLADVLGEQYPADENIFVTRWYSIENYLVSEEMLERVLAELYHLSRSDPRFILTVARYRREYPAFVLKMRVVMSWIVAQRRAGGRPNLSNVRLDQTFHIDSQLRFRRRARVRNESIDTYMERVCGVTHSPFAWKAVRRELATLAAIKDVKLYLRGKFELWFLTRFLATAKSTLARVRFAGARNVIVRTDLNSENAAEILGPRLRIPHELMDFVRRNVSQLPPLRV